MHLRRDKAPNHLGAKTMAADPTGAIREDLDIWDANVASLGCQLLAMAVHQGLLVPSDFEGLKLGERFTVPQLIAKRRSRGSAALSSTSEGMCVVPSCPF